MKTVTGIIFALLFMTAHTADGQGLLHGPGTESRDGQSGHMMGWGSDRIGEKSPGIAALLSLQPLPIALGNFYADDWEKGILYTTVELGLIIPAMMSGDGHMGHNHYGDSDHDWDHNDRVAFYSLLSGYIAVKIISAFDAGYSIERQLQDRNNVSFRVYPEADGWIASARISF